jgi:penicillin amidase
MARICEALGKHRDWDVTSCLKLQKDEESLPWREIRDVVLEAALASQDSRVRRALDLLRRWDGRVASDSQAAAVFEYFLVELIRRTVEERAPRSAPWMLGKGPSPIIQRGQLSVRRVGHLSRLLREQPDGWFPRPWPLEIGETLAAAVERLEKEHGRSVAGWAWGRVRRLTFQHPFGRSRALSPLFDIGPVPASGDTNTVSQAAVDPFDPSASPLFVPSLRAVMDVGDWRRSRFAVPGGQSGNPLSPHWDDQLPLWVRGEGVAMAWSRESVAESATDVLELVPL